MQSLLHALLRGEGAQRADEVPSPPINLFSFDSYLLTY